MTKKRSYGGRDKDKHFGPFTWTTTKGDKHPPLSVDFMYIVEPSGNNVAKLTTKRGTLHCELPRLLKASPLRDGSGSHDAIYRRFGLRLFHREVTDASLYTYLSVSLYYGDNASMSWSDKDKVKTWYFPWAATHYVSTAYYHDGNEGPSFVVPEQFVNRKFFGDLYFEARSKLEQMAPKYVFAFEDFDGERILCTAHISEKTWTYGKGFWHLFNGFRKLTVKSLEMSFDKEVGKKKGSYKGGTIGTHVNMAGDQLAAEVFLRWCVDTENGCKYLGPIHCDVAASHGIVVNDPSSACGVPK